MYKICQKKTVFYCVRKCNVSVGFADTQRCCEIYSVLPPAHTETKDVTALLQYFDSFCAESRIFIVYFFTDVNMRKGET
jgi:hypothetical protein